MTPIEKLLKESELFSGLSDASAKKIASMGKITKVPQNTMIFLEGEKGSSFFIMVEGSVRLFKSAPDGREVTVKLASPGEIFAEVVLFEKDRYPVSATALADSVLFSMSRPVFETLLDNAEFRDDFISVLMKKQRYLAGRILYLAAYDVEERFFRFLAYHYGKLQSYEITLSKKDFASAIGTIPETFSRLLQRLTSRRIIQWEGNRLTLPDDFWDRQYDD
ncbi:MAG TPA: Crp/Fnr family transcriptional regulator [Spirochaetota bacterium]|nr:Crp/Fnr family transcriptional regulator [Spirochaetota bacterium]